ncbi:MAG: AsmA family protein [Deltaproteobacteria bacterium]|nr:AsmA family protein [Deltaproteobacteria bacterium]
MARPLKWILGVFGGIIILVIIAVIVIVSSYDFNNLKPVISKAVYDATGRELVIGSDIDLDIGLTPSLVLSNVRFQNAEWGTRKDMLNVGRFELKVSLMPLLKGNVEVHRFILKDFDVLIETDKKGKANYQFDTEKKAETEEKMPGTESEDTAAPPAFAVNELEIENGVITYRDGKTGKTQNLTITNLTTGIKGLENPLTIDLSGKYNNEPFKVSGTLGSIKGLNDTQTPWPLDLSIDAFGANAGLKGSIKNPAEQMGINLDFNVKIDDWAKLSKLAETEIPLKEAFSISGNIADRASKNYYMSGLKIALGKNQINGSLGINLSGKVPYIDAALSSKELDLTTLMKEGKETEKPAEVSAKGDEEMKRLFSDEPLNLDSLKAVNGKFKISIDKLVLPEMVLNALSVDSTMNNGSLALKPLKMNMGGGNIGINIDLASKANGVELASLINVQGLELGDVLEKAGVKEKIEGLFDADIDIKGRGSSFAAIMGGLNGYTTVTMSEGVISNKYFNMLGSDFSKGIMRLLNPTAQSKDYTTIKCMVTRFDIKEGMADATVLVVDTSMMSVAGAGDINLRNETLNLSLDPSTKGGVAGYNLNIGELTQPFKLGGTLAKPSLVIDKQKAALSIGKAFGKDGLKGLLKKGTQETGAGVDVDVCTPALQAAKTGVKQTVKKEASEASTGEETQPAEPVTTEKLIEDAVKDPKKALKNLFGR